MAEDFDLNLNGETVRVSAEPDQPLLYALTDDLALKGPRFGCGLAQCGSCSVLVDGVETRSCVTPVSAVGAREVTTLEGLPAWYATRRGLRRAPALHPVQQALIEEAAPQCGYCMNGMTVKAAELLEATPDPSEAEIVAHMNGHLCRCGTYPRIVRAIQSAARAMAEA